MGSFFVFLLGASIGSFLNVIILRIEKGQAFAFGRSKCPFCRHNLRWFELIPIVSYFIQGGKCRRCKKGLSWQYFIMEAVCGLLFLLAYLKFGLSFQTAVIQIFFSFLVVIFVYDLRTYLILDRISIPAMIVGFALNFILGFNLLQLLAAAAIGAGFFALQYFISGGTWVGDGDIRLGAVMGAMLGPLNLIVALFLAYVAGSVIGIGLILAGKKKMNSAVPFGPFLCAATIASLLYGPELYGWYVNLIS